MSTAMELIPAAATDFDFDGLSRAIMVIVSSEIGDKTFLLAAILSMRHPRTTVFAGSLSALAVMSLLSSVMGQLMPALLPHRWTTAAAALLFLFFGVKMLQEGLEMEGGEKGKEKMEEEIREVQKEVEEAEEEVHGRSAVVGGGGGGTSYPLMDMEEGRLDAPPLRSNSTSPSSGHRPTKRRNSLSVPSKADAVKTLSEGVKNLAHLFFSPIFIQAFILTFLAEWGDRSQIATIAMAAAHNVWLITFGTTLGHSFCTLLAVLSGRWISQRISIKHVTLGGAVLFIIFGLVYGYEAWEMVEDAVVEGTSKVAAS